MKSFFNNRVFALFILILSFSCSKNDNCDILICQNAGQCNDGVCDCAMGYTSGNCSEQITPSSIKITKIKVLRFPSRNIAGQTWDSNNGPDIFVALGFDNDLIYEHPTAFDNASPLLSYEFIPIQDLIISNITERYSLNLFDKDDQEPHDFMGGIEFSPYTNTNNFPKIITVDAGGSVAFEVSVEYSF